MRACAATDVGKIRKVNQDSIFSSMEPIGFLKNLFMVADGMGGQKAGDYASRFVVEQMVESIKNLQTSNEIEILRQTIDVVNKKLFEVSQTDVEYEGMGTTLVAATITEETLYVANIGDSRLYLVRPNEIRQITRDHSYVEEMVSLGRMERNSQNFQAKKNIITRAVGTEKTVQADFFEVTLKKDDVILLCSDGLSNMVDNASIFRIASLKEEPKIKAEKLLSLANQNGGKDNIAVVLVEPQISEVSL